MSRSKPREITIQVLRRPQRGGVHIEDHLENALGQVRLANPDRRLTQELVLGIVRWQTALDWLICRKTPARKPSPLTRLLLRLGLYQMFWLDRIPPHAAVHQTVETAKHFGAGAQCGFINAVLRAYERERQQTARLLADLKMTQPSIGFSHPQWLCERWQEQWSAQNMIKLLGWNNTPPPAFARVNALKTDLSGLSGLWQQEGVQFIPFERDWTGPGLVCQLEKHPPLVELESFKRGGFYVQDPSTLLAVRLLEPQPGDKVLDWCSAPGGKTTFIAQLMQNRGSVVALDTRQSRLRLLKENCKRLGVTCVKPGLINPDNPQPALGQLQFDRVLVDAPCTNTGVMRRRADLRWRLEPGQILRMQSNQIQILSQAARHVRLGGVLVYSTCSLEPEENQQVTQEFLAGHPSFRVERQRQLTPFVDGVDGAYVARFMKSAT